MKDFKDDALELFDKHPFEAVLIHQVNCQGVMNSGIAKQIRETYPRHFDDYSHVCGKVNTHDLLGEFVWTYTTDSARDYQKAVVGLFSQNFYGRDGNRYTNYAAFSKALCGLIELTKKIGMNPLYIIPKYIGCGLGGGDWNIIKSILEDVEKMYNVEFMCVEFMCVELKRDV